MLLAALTAVTGWYLSKHSVAVLQPAGEIGHKERNLIIFTVLISAVVVIPVFGLLVFILYKYREGNKHAKYAPELEGSAAAETIWWLVPTFIMVVISVVTWRSSYALDPYKQLSSAKPTLHVQVVALDWKWLFIYPDQRVASVNEAAIPVGTPVDFEITSDSVMTSFWAPQLGGQMYAMPGMSTALNLEASKAGVYNGVAANISGKGFADMKFVVKALPPVDYESWIASAKQSTLSLNDGSYASLARPGEVKKPMFYDVADKGLYDTIVMKYMMPMGGNTNVETQLLSGVKL